MDGHRIALLQEITKIISVTYNLKAKESASKFELKVYADTEYLKI